MLKKLKNEKLKKLSKNRNLSKCDTKKAEPNFLTPNARKAFNYL